jgi:dTDP-4-amino-4,6-dideoxygalactose transaminase
MSEPIRVTKSFLPPFEEFEHRIKKLWDSGHLTNHGTNILELEDGLRKHLEQEHLWAVANGTLALQIAFKALDLQGEVITTPFSYVATVSSLVWEGLTPVFVDINTQDFCIDPSKIEAEITDNTSAILATHVYGHPCDVEAIEKIANKHNLKVIYDAAHAFGIEINGKSILDYGDVSTLSFHATKVFHSAEGGAVVTPHADVSHKMMYLRNFGHNGEEEFWGLGVNAKVSEFHAAMGNCVLPYMGQITAERKRVIERYDAELANLNQAYRFRVDKTVTFNYSYYPFLIESEELLLQLRDALNAEDIHPRRYFYPSLNKLPYLPKTEMPIAEDVSRRMLCLPLYTQLTNDEIDRIIRIVKTVLS